MAVQMKDEIIRSGVAHSVETSRVTNNAVNPRNTFMDVEEEAASDTSPNNDLTPVDRAMVEFDKTPDAHASKGAIPDYPVTQKSLNTKDKLSEKKSHIQDNIQALHNLAHSANKQSIGSDQFSDNYQSTGPAEHIKDHVVYLEKKSIRDNWQKAPQSIERAAAELVAPSIKSVTPVAQATPSKVEISSTEPANNTEDKLSARMRQIKAEVRTVNNSLSDIEDDDGPKPA
jgi:hypothetical protein